METLIRVIEIFAFATGIAYIVLEILQKNAMWVLGILTGAACAFSFGVQQVWASMGLNLYYMAMSVVGLVQWRRASAQVADGEIHLARLSPKTAVWSGLLFVAGTLLLLCVLRAAGDAAPALDAVSTMLSVVGTWWLAQSYLEQWLVWVVADILTSALCLFTGQYWMTVLYAVYVASAVYGWFHWKKRGKYLTA